MRRRFVDEDAELDQTAAGSSLLEGPEENRKNPSHGPAGSPGTSGRRAAPAGRERGPSTRPPRPDSATGLATYFQDACPPRSWSTGLEFSNFRAIVAIFSELLHLDVSPDTCRAMVDLYFTQLGGRTPDKAYCWDFKWRRHTLLKRLSETGVSQTDADYDDWNTTPQRNPDADTAFTNSWGPR